MPDANTYSNSATTITLQKTRLQEFLSATNEHGGTGEDLFFEADNAELTALLERLRSDFLGFDQASVSNRAKHAIYELSEVMDTLKQIVAVVEAEEKVVIFALGSGEEAA